MSRPEDVRLYAILARSADRAVVFRRGPSKQVLLVAWNTAEDTFEEGQWLKGRVYERRCDLSPNGQFLLYFAANNRPPYGSWSAVSRPPYLTALALWPKGDAWGGGGHFASDTHILLNHAEYQMDLAPEFKVPKWLRVTPFGQRLGEDNPVWAERLTRDGWVLVSRGRETDAPEPVFIHYDPPVVWEKRHPRLPAVLQMSISALHERNGPWYRTDHSVVYSDGEVEKIGRSDWADWDRNGDLLFAQACKLYRSAPGPPLRPRIIADLAGRTFTERQAPESARRW